MHSLDALPDGAALARVAADEAPPPVNLVSAGFGSPGADVTVRRINLNEALIRHPQATFVMRAAGSAMASAGIADGDVLLVDRAIKPVHGSIVIAVVDGELLCRRLWKKAGQSHLEAAGKGEARPAVQAPVEVWGVVTTAIRSLLA